MQDGWPSHSKQENTNIKTCRMGIGSLEEIPIGNSESLFLEMLQPQRS